MDYTQRKIDNIRAILKAAQTQIDMALRELDNLERATNPADEPTDDELPPLDLRPIIPPYE